MEVTLGYLNQPSSLNGVVYNVGEAVQWAKLAQSLNARVATGALRGEISPPHAPPHARLFEIDESRCAFTIRRLDFVEMPIGGICVKAGIDPVGVGKALFSSGLKPIFGLRALGTYREVPAGQPATFDIRSIITWDLLGMEGTDETPTG